MAPQSWPTAALPMMAWPVSARQEPVPHEPAQQEPVRQKSPRLGDSPGSPRWPLVPLGLTALLGLLVWASMSQVHLLAAARLVPWIGAKPGSPLSPEQVGKLIALGGFAVLGGSLLLLLLHLPHSWHDRQLARRMAGLLVGGGIVYLALDMAPALDLLPTGPPLWLYEIAEETVQWSVLAAAALLLARRWLIPVAKSEPPP